MIKSILLLTYNNLVLIGSIWIFIGIVLVSKLSNMLIILFGVVVQYINHSIYKSFNIVLIFDRKY